MASGLSLASTIHGRILGSRAPVKSESRERSLHFATSVAVRCQNEQAQTSKTLSRRDLVSLVSVASSVLFIPPSALALLEADEDEELLEKIKTGRKQKLSKRDGFVSYNDEATVQKAVYRLSKAGQAIEGDDFEGAAQVLGSSLEADWAAEVISALDKAAANEEEKSVAAQFSSSLAYLQTAVSAADATSAKEAYVATGSALEAWAQLSGAAQGLKGL